MRMLAGLAALALLIPTGGSASVVVPSVGTSTQLLSANLQSNSPGMQGSIMCKDSKGTSKGTLLGAGVRDAEGTWISGGLLTAQSSMAPSTSVNGAMTSGTRQVRTVGGGASGWILRMAWPPQYTQTLKAPYRLYFAVGTFGERLDRCTMRINGIVRPISRTGRAGYVDLGAPNGNLATTNRGPDESIRAEAWVPAGPRTVTLSGGRMFGSAAGLPANRVVAWRPTPAGVDAPFAVLDGQSFGADAATRIDLVNAGAWLAGRGFTPPTFMWFDLGR